MGWTRNRTAAVGGEPECGDRRTHVDEWGELVGDDCQRAGGGDMPAALRLELTNTAGGGRL